MATPAVPAGQYLYTLPMASGIEAAGLAIGAIQLMSKSLEQLKHGPSVIRSYRDARQEIEQVIRELRSQQVIIQQTLEVPLREAFAEREVHELLSDLSSPAWQSEEIELALRKSLGEGTYTIFVSVLSQLFDAVSSIAKSLGNITDESKGNQFISRSRLKWALQAGSKTRESLSDLRNRNRDLVELVNSVHCMRNFETAQAIENLTISLHKVLEIQQLAQNVEDLATGATSTAHDARSTYTVESEVSRDDCSGRPFADSNLEAEREGPALSYLPLTLEAAAERLKKDALLDTGATACAISTTVANELKVDIQHTDERMVRTAALNQDLRVKGKVQLNLRWKDEHGKRFGTRMWVYVVYELAHSVLLSHDFTNNHPEVWSIARTVAYVAEQLNVTWFSRLKKEQQEAEDEHRKRRQAENTAKADAEKQDRLTELDQKLSNDDTPSNPVSASGGSING